MSAHVNGRLNGVYFIPLPLFPNYVGNSVGPLSQAVSNNLTLGGK